MTSSAENLHATCLALDGRGVIIFGRSGAGKTSLALELIREAVRSGIKAVLVADDRVDVWRSGSGLTASPPRELAGLVEVRGSGIHEIEHQSAARLDLAVELADWQAAERVQPLAPKLVAHGLSLPVLILPQNQTAGAVRAVLAHLGLYPPVRAAKKNQ